MAAYCPHMFVSADSCRLRFGCRHLPDGQAHYLQPLCTMSEPSMIPEQDSACGPQRLDRESELRWVPPWQ